MKKKIGSSLDSSLVVKSLGLIAVISEFQ